MRRSVVRVLAPVDLSWIKTVTAALKTGMIAAVGVQTVVMSTSTVRITVVTQRYTSLLINGVSIKRDSTVS